MLRGAPYVVRKSSALFFQSRGLLPVFVCDELGIPVTTSWHDWPEELKKAGRESE